jgi:SAM-dependent methyltransferase
VPAPPTDSNAPPQPESSAGDRAGAAFWDGLWASKTSPPREIGSPRLKHWEVQHAVFFDRAFSLLGETKGKHLLEIGAGDSGWLPYFAKRWGFQISGLDYSPVGCERASALASTAGVHVNMILADMFDPPAALEGAVDVIVSIGVVEHYEDTELVLRALSWFVRPGGILVTIVPNMPGLVGWLFRIFNRPVYDIHIPLDSTRLRAAHEQAGLDLTSCENMMSINLGVPNLVGLDPSKLSTKLKRLVLLAMIAFSRAVWAFERLFGDLPSHSYVSPYIATVARKPVLPPR